MVRACSCGRRGGPGGRCRPIRSGFHTRISVRVLRLDYGTGGLGLSSVLGELSAFAQNHRALDSSISRMPLRIRMQIIDPPTPSRPRPRTCPTSCAWTSATPTTRRARARLRMCSAIPPRLLRNGEGWAIERQSIGTHAAHPRRRPLALQQRSRARRRRRSTSCRWSGSSGPAWCSTPTGRPTATPSRAEEMAQERRGRPRARARRHRARPDRAGRLLRRARLHAPRLRRHRRGDPLALRPRRAGDGDRRLGLGRAAGPAGRGGAGARRAGHLLGGAPGRPAVLADRAAGQPRRAAADRIHGRLLPAQDRGRSAGPARVVAILDA